MYTKICSTCREALPGTKFHYQEASPDGCTSICKDCFRKYARNRYQTRPDVREKHRIYRASPEIKALRNARNVGRDYSTNQHRAHGTVARAISNGLITRPSRCSNCENYVDVEAHHADYSKPLEVSWLCKLCHEHLHRLQDETDKEKSNVL